MSRGGGQVVEVVQALIFGFKSITYGLPRVPKVAPRAQSHARTHALRDAGPPL
jgi:hypothetical protein